MRIAYQTVDEIIQHINAPKCDIIKVSLLGAFLM